MTTSIQEYSKNDPIPEINRFKEKLLVIMMGTPGIGKSTFTKDFILPKNNTFKVVNPDDIDKTLTGRDDTFIPSSGKLAEKVLQNLINDKVNIIYDVTGTNEARVLRVIDMAKKGTYTIIFIHLLADLYTSLRQNMQRARHVPEDAIKDYYKKSQAIMHKYDNAPHNGYYVVLSLNRKYKFMKYEHGKFLKRTNAGYAERE